MADPVQANLWAYDLGSNLKPSSEISGGNFFAEDDNGDIMPAETPHSHPFYQLDGDGNIIPREVVDIREYYLDLITSLYRNKPKFMAWLDASLKRIPYPQELATFMDIAFELDNAEGNQLDVLGSIVGASRQVNFIPTDASSSLLNDTYYRILLKAKIAKNLWNGKIDSLQPIWQSLFPGGAILIRDNQNMTMDVTIFGSVPLMVRDLVANGYIVPKPQTVRLDNVLYSNYKPAFGYDMSNEYVDGYDIGYWILPLPAPPFFGYDQYDAVVAGYNEGSWDYT
jgi:hypothetical protein